MRLALVSGLGGLMLAACQAGGSKCEPADPRVLSEPQGEVSVLAARSAAIAEVRDRYPSRALVDFANVEQTETGPAVFVVHVEMTGAPAARAIYDVEVTEIEPGKLSVTGFTKLQ